MRVALLSILLVAVAHCKEDVKHGSVKQDHYKDGGHNSEFDHQAVLGSEDEVEEFAQLPPEEAQKRLGQLVDKMDLNSDGFVDSTELASWIKNSFHKMNLEEASQALENDDANGDGKMTWEELLQSNIGMTEEEVQAYRNNDLDDPVAKEKVAVSMAYVKSKYDIADEDGDGFLTVDEYAAYLHPYDYDRMVPVEVQRVLDEFDKNKDGFVDATEYLVDSEAKSDEDKISEEENFRYNDKNSDGKLDREEIAEWVSPESDQVAQEETSHLFEITDSNLDGVLSKDEIVENHESWVGSEATNYGYMLHDEL